jgi:hypothetical protein
MQNAKKSQANHLQKIASMVRKFGTIQSLAL